LTAAREGIKRRRRRRRRRGERKGQVLSQAEGLDDRGARLRHDANARMGSFRMAEPEIDLDRIDEAVLALMFLTLHKERNWELWRAWKSFDWAAMGRLHGKDLIFNPVGKAESVMLTDEGYRRSEEAYFRLFARQAEPPAGG
jgi:hypothetical protein